MNTTLTVTTAINIIMQQFEKLSKDKKEEVLAALQAQYRKDNNKKMEVPPEVIHEIYWDRDKILDYVKNKLFQIREYKSTDPLWFLDWNEVSITLPPIWEFKWLDINCFEWKTWISIQFFRENKNLVERSYSIEEITEILKKINEFFEELWVKNVGDIRVVEDEKSYDRVVCWEGTITLRTIWLTGGCLLKDMVEGQSTAYWGKIIEKVSWNNNNANFVLLKLWI